MTRKLYYEDCHLRSFTAAVTGCTPVEDFWQITLDATAFYPEGGGQAADHGLLGDANVLDVQEKDGCILHLCDAPLAIGQTVHGQIDWARRFDLMQQHTGEHILSGLIHKKFGYHNTGFHVGADVMEVDFDGQISGADLAELERLANEAIWANIPLKCWIPAPDELPSVVYRTKRPLPWPVRIVQIPGYDSCACCGIHVKHTGEVGLLKILSCTALRGGVRLEMVCGRRAYEHMVTIFEENRKVSQTFSAPMQATGDAAQRMQAAFSAEKYRSMELQTRLFSFIAENYAGRGDVIHFEAALSGSSLRLLAERIADRCGGRAAVFAGEDGEYAYCLVQKNGDLRPLNQSMNDRLHGKGGGKPPFQQGIVHASKEEILAFFA